MLVQIACKDDRQGEDIASQGRGLIVANMFLSSCTSDGKDRNHKDIDIDQRPNTLRFHTSHLARPLPLGLGLFGR